MGLDTRMPCIRSSTAVLTDRPPPPLTNPVARPHPPDPAPTSKQFDELVGAGLSLACAVLGQATVGDGNGEHDNGVDWDLVGPLGSAAAREAVEVQRFSANAEVQGLACEVAALLPPPATGHSDGEWSGDG